MSKTPKKHTEHSTHVKETPSVQPKPEAKSSLAQWEKLLSNDQTLKMGDNDAEPISVLLGRYGLKKPEDLDKFLKTPAGRTLEEQLVEQVVLERVYIERMQAEYRESQFVKRLQSALFLWLVAEESAAKEQIKALTAETQQLVSNLKNQPKPKAAQSPIEVQAMKELAQINNKIGQQVARSQELQVNQQEIINQLAELDAQMKHLEEHYALFEEHTHNELFSEFVNEDGDIHIDKVSVRQKELEANMEQLFAEISDHLDQDLDPTHLLHQQNAYNLEMATLHDMAAVFHQKKFYLDANGNATQSFHKAEFVLQKDQKLVKHDGKYFLLKPTQDWDQVKENPDAMTEAQKHFEVKKPQIMTVKNVVMLNRGVEESSNLEQKKGAHAKLFAIQTEQKDIAQQILQLNAHRATLVGTLAQLRANPMAALSMMPAPSTTVKQHAHAPSPRPTPTNTITAEFKKRYEALILDRELTKTKVMNFAKSGPKGFQEQVQQAINTQMTRRAGLSPNTPTMLRAALEDMRGIVYGKNRLVKEQSPNTPEEYKPSHLSPFSTKLKPY